MDDAKIGIDDWVEDQIRSLIMFRDYWKVMKNNDSALLGEALHPVDWAELHEAFGFETACEAAAPQAPAIRM